MRKIHGCRIRVFDAQRAVMLPLAAAAIISVFVFGRALPQNTDTRYLKMFLCGTVPVLQSYINPEIEIDISPSRLLLGFDISDPVSIISSQIAVVSAADRAASEDEEPVEVVQPPHKETAQGERIEEITVDARSASGYVSAEGVYVKNGTNYEINIEKLINEDLKIKLSKGAPQVLIVHTHASEAFSPSDKNYYEPTDPDRTEDTNFNIVRVGREMAEVLNAKGIETLHDTTLHDYPSYNGSYKNCLATVQRYLKEHPSIKVVLDIHRDGMATSDGKKLKVCTTIDGKKTAQVMILCGTDGSGLEHPGWRENLKLALRMQATMNEMYPSLARPLSLVNERYNMHTSNGSLLIEVGSNGNTLEEALRGGHCAAEAIAKLLKDLEKR